MPKMFEMLSLYCFRFSSKKMFHIMMYFLGGCSLVGYTASSNYICPPLQSQYRINGSIGEDGCRTCGLLGGTDMEEAAEISGVFFHGFL